MDLAEQQQPLILSKGTAMDPILELKDRPMLLVGTFTTAAVGRGEVITCDHDRADRAPPTQMGP